MRKRPEAERSDLSKDIWGILFLALGAFLALTLVSYDPADPALNSASNAGTVHNLCGVVGAYTSDVLFTIFGISAYFTALFCFGVSLMHFFGRSLSFKLRDLISLFGLIAFIGSIIHLSFPTVTIASEVISGGGIIGGLLGEALARFLNRTGAYVVSSTCALLFFVLATHITIGQMLRGSVKGSVWLSKGLAYGSVAFTKAAWAKSREWSIIAAQFTADMWQLLLERFKGVKTAEAESEESVGEGIFSVRIERPMRYSSVGGEEAPSEAESDEDSAELAEDDEDEELFADDDDAAEEDAELAETDEDELAASSASTSIPGGPKILKRVDHRKKLLTDAQLRFMQMKCEGYELPPLSLLDQPPPQRQELDEENLRKNSLLLTKKLADFDVLGKVTAIRPGPVITMYEFEPSAGTKVNKVVNLEDDLSLALGGRSVRIIPHLPGKAAVGIEVPNHERETVYIKDIIASPSFQKNTNKIPIALGTNTEGIPVVADLAKLPHALIAGATGSGKSVAINSMLMSILFKMSPEDVRLILVDPKMLELSIYAGIPHLLLPVVTKPKQAIAAMRWAVKEMERRYRLMADTGTRNITGYNEKIKKDEVKLTPQDKAEEMLALDAEAVVHTGNLPYIVIIIDELADLMMTSSQEMEETIIRLAQMARASGIHLVLATQRPSVDVVTGLIKANFPARIAFKVSSRHDSRTILDTMGAEQLLGMGDMLYMSPSGSGMVRHHGCLVTDSEIARVITHLKQQGEPIYNEAILQQAESDAEAAEAGYEDVDDELYDKAIALVCETRQASISMVQRRLRIGYNRAARMIEKMESEGVVGPASGSKPREVYAQNVQK